MEVRLTLCDVLSDVCQGEPEAVYLFPLLLLLESQDRAQHGRDGGGARPRPSRQVRLQSRHQSQNMIPSSATVESSTASPTEPSIP